MEITTSTPAQSAQVTAVNAVPVGTIVCFATGTPPEGWLLCNGQTITQSNYPNLYALIGSTVPDLRDRFIVGAGQNYAQNAKGGSDTVTLTVDQIPPHQHFGFGEVQNTWPLGVDTSAGGGQMGSHGGIDYDNYYYGTTYTGGGQGHENRPPYYALTYIIKY